METKNIRLFNLDYLNELIERDNAILIGNYNKLNSSINIVFKCKCTKETNKLFRDISYYGGAFCKECIKINKTNKIKNTCLEKYGVTNPSQLDLIKKIKENTYLENYGDHPKRIKEVQDKYVNTCLERYGTINSAQAEHVKYKIKNTFDIKYNGHPMFNEEIKNKVKDTCLEKYGGHPMTCEEIKNKVKDTCLERYGGFPTQCKDIQDKIKISNLNKYGCHPSQTSEVIEKVIKSSKSYKKYIMPNGEIRNVQGYEPFALDILLTQYSDTQIKTNKSDIPVINYIFNDKHKKYFPDIYIPDSNLIIEVKSDWIYNKQLELNKIKEEFTKKMGYNYELWIFNRKGIKI